MTDPEIHRVGTNGVIEVIYVASKTIGGIRTDLGEHETFEDAEQAILADESAKPAGTRVCHDCDGTGELKGEECNMCAGTGRIAK